MNIHKERRLEEEICQHLDIHGWEYAEGNLAFRLANEGKEIDHNEVERDAAMKGIMRWVRLLQRTSRIVTTTEIGKEYYRHAQDALTRFEAAETAIRRRTNNIEGSVTVSCSVGMPGRP